MPLMGAAALGVEELELELGAEYELSDTTGLSMRAMLWLGLELVSYELPPALRLLLPPPIPVILESFCRSRMALAASFAWSRADSILLVLIIKWSFSSWLSISMLVFICCRLMGSLYPPAVMT